VGDTKSNNAAIELEQSDFIPADVFNPVAL
jgi:hypothetical protein